MLFNCRTYKEFLTKSIKANHEVRGYKTLLAKAAGCQLAYLTQVLKSKVQLTPDHALSLADFFEMNERERDYFLLLVNHERAGTQKLKSHLQDKLDKIKKQVEDIGARLQKPELDNKWQEQFYSSWHWLAISIAVTIPNLQTAESIAMRLHLPHDFVVHILQKLEGMQIIEKKQGRWKPLLSDFHLSKDSPFTSMNHSNWRDRAVLDSQQKNSTNLHYTSVYSLSKSDFEKIKSELHSLLDRTRNTVLKSAEEELAGFTLDWFIL